MKICFIRRGSINMQRGSYRIWVNDLNHYFNKVGIESIIKPENYDNYDIHIYGKNNYKIKNKNKINGIINPDADCNLDKLSLFDFIIVGSLEEKDSLIKYHDNIFIFPLIEKMYLNVKPKEHKKKDEIIIGYHGNQNHLNHLTLGLDKALERLNDKFNIKLIYLCSNNEEWKDGIPNIKKQFIKWELDNIKNTILSFDIGIIPNISEYYNDNDLDENIELGKYNTDIKVRFKNKSNNGRLLVLAQCGIPVVADMTPSNMHVLGNPDNGFAVLSSEGWYKALYKLCESYELRNFVSKNAYNEVRRLYDPYKLAKKLYDNILTVKKNKNYN